MRGRQPASGGQDGSGDHGTLIATVSAVDDGVSPARMAAHLSARIADLSVPRLLRQALFLATLLLAWISLKPFPDLARLDAADLVTGQEALTYAAYGLLALAGLLLVARDHGRALASLATPTHLALAGWLGLSVVLSQDSATSAKRLALTAAVMLLAACLPLLARTGSEFRNLLTVAALGLLAVCYVGLVVAPDLAIHQPRDLMEPALVGNWRGAFGHKNAAAAVMAMLMFVGVAVLRTGAPVAGLTILGLSSLFLVGSEGKSAFALSLLVFAMSGAFAVVRSFRGRLVLALGPVVLVNLLTVGTVMSDTIASLAAALPIDATFTGRTDIWRFAVESIAARPVTGHGFAAFWGTQTLRDISDDGSTWAGYASHSHNGYLDTTLTLGLVGLVLLVLVFVLGPLRNDHRLRTETGNAGPFATMFLQIWLFGLLLSTMESFFFDRADPIWVTFLFPVFGLHYLARFRSR